MNKPIERRLAGTATALLILASGAIAATDPDRFQPERIPFQYGQGKQRFEALCAECHGQWGGGSEQGPPLMHGYYKPSHHSNRAFAMAIRRGTHQHHWDFGPMQPVEGASDQDVVRIIEYVRWLQAQNGIR